MGTPTERDRASIFDLAGSYYMVSRVIQAAAQLGVFAQLASEAQTTEALAARCHASAHGMQALLVALQALGLVARTEGRWSLPPDIRAQLPDEDILAGLVGGYRDWLALEDAVTTGTAAAKPAFDKDPASLRQFLIAMHHSSLPVAREVAAMLAAPGPRRVLDLGGGLGTYAAAICQRFEEARAVVLELPQVASIGRQLVAHVGLGQRIRFLEGDYLATPFPPGNDLILMCNILHQEKPRAVRLLFQKAAEALADGGHLLIHETLLSGEGAADLPTALAALNSLLYYGGETYRAYQIHKWLAAAGLDVQRATPMGEPGVQVIVAQRAP
ncbi:MAG: methyltransferase domain-containing protein [Chloroflexi bacterium]|nr:methyltransferase domain-containing protein [Chloroflexota bacterium]